MLGSMLLLPTLSFIGGQHRSAQAAAGAQTIAQPDDQEPASYIKRAVELANISVQNGDGTAYGAVVVKDGRIIGEGRNRTNLLNDPTAHSEIDAIRDACSRTGSKLLTGCEIYCSARPCPMCSSACYWAKLERIYVGSVDSEIISIEPVYSNC